VPPQGTNFSSTQAKVDWLLAHPHTWEGWTNTASGGDHRLWTIVAALKEAGLVSMKTYALDVHLNGLIAEARKQRREQKGEIPCSKCGEPTTFDPTYGDLCYRCCRADNE
jgi:hypothetical protein